MSDQSHILGPQPGPQTDFLSTTADIAFYGGQAGGGKTFGILMDAARHMETPNAGAIIFRRTYPEVMSEGGLWDESHKIYPLIGGKPRTKDLQWVFPSGFKITFRHMQNEADKFSYQGSQVPVIYFDEVTHFTESQFFYMLSRNRSTSGIKPYMRATCNPYPNWVKRFLAPWVDDRYRLRNPWLAMKSGEILYMRRKGNDIEWVHPKDYLPSMRLKSVTFIRSTIHDNQKLLEANPEYLDSLMALPTVERERLLSGNWDVEEGDILFKRADFIVKPSDEVPWTNFKKFVRYWDTASTERRKATVRTAATAGVLMTKDETNGDIWILDVRREQFNWNMVEELIEKTAEEDLMLPGVTPGTLEIFVEQEPGASGVGVIDHICRRLTGFKVSGDLPSGDKVTRSQPFQSASSRNLVMLREAQWNEPYLAEAEVYPLGLKDQIDASSGAHNQLRKKNAFYFA